MFVYTTTSYPTYSSPALYPLSHYIGAPSAPTARERYLRAVAEAQYARARYLSELEEQHILASLQQQEALRQVDFRRRKIFAAQNDIARRRVGHIYAGNLCRSVASLQGRRQAFARQQRENCFPTYEPQDSLSNLEAIISALLPDGREEGYMTERETEKARIEEARKKDALNARDRFVKMLERALDAIHTDHSTQNSQPSQPSNNAPAMDPFRDPSSQTEIPYNRLAYERAARTIQQRWRSHSADALARKDAVTTIATLRGRFQFLRDTFSFPEHLEFREHVADQRQGVPTLLFTPANAAVHAYSHELTKLLTLADAVPSHGSHGIRKERRSFVRLVEEALDGVDRRVAEIWGNRTKASATMNSSTDALETPSAVPLNEVQSASESIVRSAAPDVSVPEIESTAADSEPLGSPSTDTSTIIPSHVTVNVDPPALDNIQSSEVLPQDVTSQDVPSESEVPKRLPSPEEALNSQPDVATVTSTREDHGAAIQTQFNVDTIQTTRDLNTADTSPSLTLSQSQPSEGSQVSTVGRTELTGIDVVLTSEEVDLTSDSPVPGLNNPQSFDIVYPDSMPSSPVVVASDIDTREPTQGPSGSTEKGEMLILPEVGREAQTSLKQEDEEETFELL